MVRECHSQSFYDFAKGLSTVRYRPKHREPTENGCVACCSGAFFPVFISLVVMVGLVTQMPVTFAAESVRVWKAIAARPYLVSGTDRRLLARADQFAADEQWDDALAAITRLLAQDSDKVVQLEDDYFVSLPEYCHRRIAQFPTQVLSTYRRLVDPISRSWYERGIAERDEKLLQKVIDEKFCSSWGDDALFALGEIALERGDYQAARNAWSQLLPSNAGLNYPDAKELLLPANARLVLVSIRESNWQRAERELSEFVEAFPGARGRLGGRDVNLAEHLADLLKQARRWPERPSPTDWKTFALSPQRTNTLTVSRPQSAYELLWSKPIANEELSIFPIVIGDRVVYQDDSSVHALRLADGKELFTAAADTFRSPATQQGWLGRPLHTLTASGNLVFGTTTTAIGNRRRSGGSAQKSVCWCLNLEREGALEFQLAGDDPSIAFAGAPLIVGNQILVAIRSNDQTARAGVACYDLDTREQLWLRWLCQANTPATGWTREIATNLLTYDAGVIYANTNLGAIAAVRAADGQILWLRTYDRQSAPLDGEGECAYYRGPNPCVYYQGAVFALPSDSNSLFAMDARTGARLWRHRVTDPNAELLSAIDGRILLVNHGLQALKTATGKLSSAASEMAAPKSIVSGEFLVTTNMTQLSVRRLVGEPDVDVVAKQSPTP